MIGNRLLLNMICLLVFTGKLFCQISNPKNIPSDWHTDTSNHIVNYTELTVAAPKDAVKTLDFPVFITRDDALYNYYDYEPVIMIHINNEARAYPLSVLTLYELANDTIDGVPIMVTYCPMCNSEVVYNREVNTPSGTKQLTFGISGLLCHNDMIMFDRETESWWEQIMGNGIAGKYSGTDLEMIPAMLISVYDYFDRFPHGKILSPEYMDAYISTHHHRPFHNLEHHNSLIHKYYLPEETDPRLPPLEHVLDVHIENHDRIYPFHALAQQPVVNEIFGDIHIVIFYHGEMVSTLDKDDLSKSKHVGSATAFESRLNGVNYTFQKTGNYFTDDQTHSIWDITGYCKEGVLQGQQLWMLPQSNHFAFAYLAFFPDVEIFGVTEKEDE